MIEAPRKPSGDELRNETLGRALRAAAFVPQTAFRKPNRPHHRRAKHKHKKHGNG
jgi:hypothetical protein